jgi:hypothetical protein
MILAGTPERPDQVQRPCSDSTHVQALESGLWMETTVWAGPPSKVIVTGRVSAKPIEFVTVTVCCPASCSRARG